ncbi:MAG: hypothetical protein JW808_10185 [Victivallales bacterium]|nr:hypothetical protein [Victivallales bacterium]
MIKISLAGKFWTAFILTFASGIAIGVVVGMSLDGSRHQPAPAPPGITPAGQGYVSKGRLAHHMSKELDLNPEQKSEVEKVLAEMTRRIQAAHSERIPEIKAIMEESFSRIELLLDDSQKERLARIRERLDRMASHRRGQKDAVSPRPNPLNGDFKPPGRIPKHMRGDAGTRKRLQRQATEDEFHPIEDDNAILPPSDK